MSPHPGPRPRRRLIAPWLFCWAMAGAPPAWAGEQADKAAIAQRLHDWAAAFNAGDAAGACDLFAPDLISTVQGAPDAGRDAVCARLSAALAKPGSRGRYHPDIQEIIVSGDLAIVRLTWTLTVRQGQAWQRSRERGLDVFRRQEDGRWSISRFFAFPSEPDGPAAWTPPSEGGRRQPAMRVAPVGNEKAGPPASWDPASLGAFLPPDSGGQEIR